MDFGPMQQTFLYILLLILLGQGDGSWKKSNREMLQHDIKLFKKMAERIKEELGIYYEDYSDEPFADYFFEEIDYLQSKIDSNTKRKVRKHRRNKINYSHIDHSGVGHKPHYTEDTTDRLQDLKPSVKNVTFVGQNSEWPSFEDILTDMGKKYDWKNDRWIKVKNKTKNIDKHIAANLKNNVEHLKHNFRYRIVKLNRAKSKRNIVVAVTAVR